ncbi:MAG: damage-inducible protein [Acetobacteraceae bacterium]|nr:damage-inducible protein [Acetobacteraceae bacterium]
MSNSPALAADPGKLAALRAALCAHAVGRRHGTLAFGDARVDGCLPDGGLALGAVHEIAAAAGRDAETGAAAAGFIAAVLARLPAGEARPIFWIAPADDLHPPGLLPYGLDPGRLILVASRDDAETLGAAELALRGGAAAAVVAEVGTFRRTPSRRLGLACGRHGTPGFVLRRWPWGGRRADRETAAAATRWRIAPLPSAASGRLPGGPRWAVTLEHARGGTEGAWVMEVVDGTHALRVVAELADAAAAPARPLRARG